MTQKLNEIYEKQIIDLQKKINEQNQVIINQNQIILTQNQISEELEQKYTIINEELKKNENKPFKCSCCNNSATISISYREKKNKINTYYCNTCVPYQNYQFDYNKYYISKYIPNFIPYF